jgi:hypothetical protein
MQTIFSGDHARAYLIAKSPHDLVFTFDFWTPRKSDFIPARAGTLLAKSDASQLIVQTRRNDWFLNADLPALLDACGAAAKPYANVLCYGFSMGAYGAMIFSGAVGASRVVCVSPQFSVDPAKVPFEKRWLKDALLIDFTHERFEDRINRDAPGLIVFDPMVRDDARHAELILERVPEWRAVRFFRAGHPATGLLREAGSVGDFGREILKPQTTARQLLSLHRAARRRSASYWDSIAEDAGARRPALARTATRHAMQCNLRIINPRVALRIVSKAYEFQIVGAAKALESAAATTWPQPPGWQRSLRAILYAKIGSLQSRVLALRSRAKLLQSEVNALKAKIAALEARRELP